MRLKPTPEIDLQIRQNAPIRHQNTALCKVQASVINIQLKSFWLTGATQGFPRLQSCLLTSFRNHRLYLEGCKSGWGLPHCWSSTHSASCKPFNGQNMIQKPFHDARGIAREQGMKRQLFLSDVENRMVRKLNGWKADLAVAGDSSWAGAAWCGGGSGGGRGAGGRWPGNRGKVDIDNAVVLGAVYSCEACKSSAISSLLHKICPTVWL